MAVTRRKGSNSYFLFGLQTDYDTHIESFVAPTNKGDKGALHRRRFPFTRLTLDATGEQTQSESIVGGRADSLNTLDRLSGAGDFEGEVLPEDIPYLAELIMAPKTKPTTEALDDEESLTLTGSGTTTEYPAPAYPSKVSFETVALGNALKGTIFIRPSTAYLVGGSLTDISGISAIGAITAVSTTAEFNGASDTDNDVLVVTAAISTGITKERASDTDISSAAKGDIFQYDGSYWIKRGNLTSLSDITSATLGTIYVAQTVASPAVNDIVIFSAAAASLHTGSTNVVRIRGFRRIGRSNNRQESTVEYVTLDSSMDGESSKFFTKFATDGMQTGVRTPKGRFVMFSRPAASTITYIPDTYKTEMLLGVDQSPGFTTQMVKGGIPVSAFGVIANQAEYRVGSGGVRILLNLLANDVRNRTMLTDVTQEVLKYNVDPTDDSIIAADAALTNFPLSNLNYYPRWGGALYYGQDQSAFGDAQAKTTTPTPFSDLIIRINQNYEEDDAITGDREAGQPIDSDRGVIEITFEADVYTESSDDLNDFEQNKLARWQNYFRDNTTTTLDFFSFNFLDDGRQYLIHVSCPVAQLTEMPVLIVEGRQQMKRRLVWKCVPSTGAAADSPDTLKMVFYTAEETYAA